MIHLEVDQNTREYQLYENADYQSFWKGTQQIKLDELEKIVVREMLHLPAKRIIDIGCGYGRLLDCYQDKCAEIILLDSSASLLQQAFQKTNGRVICIRCDLTKTPFKDSSFDQVMMVRVFHHIPDSKATLIELNRILVNGGNLLFSYCNKKNLERIARWLFGKNPYNPFIQQTSWVWNVFFMHHPRLIKECLNETGFTHIHQKGVGIVDKIAGKLGSLGQKLPPGRMFTGLFAALELAPWMFCDAQKTGARTGAGLEPLELIFRCLECSSPLYRTTVGLNCGSCGTVYPLVDGVYHFIPHDQE